MLRMRLFASASKKKKLNTKRFVGVEAVGMNYCLPHNANDVLEKMHVQRVKIIDKLFLELLQIAAMTQSL